MKSVLAGVLALSSLMGSSAAPPSPRPSPPPSPRVSPSPSPPPAAPASPTDYRVGAGDILEVTVFGNDDLSRVATVQPSGTISLPLVGDLAVAGLTVNEVKDKVTAALGRDYLVNPQVDVKVREFHSQFVTVIGEVNSPGRKPLRGQTRLIDALVDAGGFNSRASGDIVITRADSTLPGGRKSIRLRLGSGELTPADQVNLELRLVSGDIITASPKYYVTVEGEVARPGRFQFDSDLTLSGAVTSAGGLTRFGSNNIKVRRVNPETGTTQILEVDLKDVRKGKKPDLLLLPNDVVTVSRRRF